MLELYRGKKGFKVNVAYPQEDIQLKLYNTETASTLNLRDNQYLCMETIEPLLFQEHFQKKLRGISGEIMVRRREEERVRIEEGEKRAEAENESKRKEAVREVEMLRIEQEKLRILLENQKITQEMRELEENEVQGDEWHD